MTIKTPGSWITLFAALLSNFCFAQKNNQFPTAEDPLHLRVKMYEALTLDNHWNEGTILFQAYYPPAAKPMPGFGSHADLIDATGEMLVAYSCKYAITKNESDKNIADQVFEGILTAEKVTGVPGLVSRGFYKTTEPQWFERMWYDEWHPSSSMPGYRWLGDLSIDKLVSVFHAVGMYYELCANPEQKSKVEGLLSRFIGKIVADNFRIMDLDGKLTLWGNMCPDLPHNKLNSLVALAAVKTAHQLTGEAKFASAYKLLIDTYHYDDRQLLTNHLYPESLRHIWDDYHAVRSLYMVMKYETDPDLLNKYRMTLNRQWHVWKDITFEEESTIFYLMLYDVITKEGVMQAPARIEALKNMNGHARRKRSFEVPMESGSLQKIESDYDHASTAFLRNYWFGRYYGFIDPTW
ncbi:hypothetical protein GCM10009119_42340 [Algoriphagus jejuensis]|uniref:Glycosyl hydrolase family 88 n=1 Tax=Algoriphagus jejuensis TaxID=419934 RepID=A0ABP3YJS9_9BACT